MNKKLGLLLLPLVPLTAIGIVEVAGKIMPSTKSPGCELPVAPSGEPHVVSRPGTQGAE